MRGHFERRELRWDLHAYEIDHNVTVPGYLGCYADGPMRAMNAQGKYVDDPMTNEVGAYNLLF